MGIYIVLGAMIITVLLFFIFLYKKKENLMSSPNTVIMGFKEFVDLYNVAPEEYQLYDYWAERYVYYYYDAMEKKKVFKLGKLEDAQSFLYREDYNIIKIKFNRLDAKRYHKWNLERQKQKVDQENMQLQAMFIAAVQEDINKFYEKIDPTLNSKST